MIKQFQNDEDGYQEWRARNPRGFVFNHFGGREAAYNVIHKATCWHLNRRADDSRRTVVEKIVSNDLGDLMATAERLTSGCWKRCGWLPPA